VAQACVVHVIRNAMRFVSYKDRKKVASSMRAIYSAPTVDAAELALKEFDSAYGQQYPGAIDVWRNAWPEFVPFLDYPVELCKVVHITNAIECTGIPNWTVALNTLARLFLGQLPLC
jgi:putative transposase